MRGLRVSIIVLALLTFSASASALSLPFQFGSLMGFPATLTGFGSMNSSGLNVFNAIANTPTTDLSSVSPTFTTNSGANRLQNDFLSNLYSTGLQSFPIIGQSNNLNMVTQTPTATSYHESTPTPVPTLAPTPTPATSSQPLPLAGQNTYYDSDNGKTVTINNGDTLEVRLEESIDGKWNMNTTDGLQIVGNTFYQDPVKTVNGIVIVNDSAGTRVFEVKATKPGVQKISATRSYIGGSSNYELTVNVV